MDYKPFLPKQIDTNKITYQPPKKNQSGGKSILVSYGGERLVLQLPVMYMPYGISDSANIPSKPGEKKTEPKPPRYVVDLSFRGKEENKALENFFKKLQDIDAKIKKDAFANRVSWLGSRYQDMEPLVNELYSSNLRFDMNKETGEILNRYPPTFRTKIPYNNETDQFNFDCFDFDGHELDFKSIKDKLKGAKCRVLIQMVGIWIAGGRYGCTWKVINGGFQLKQTARYVPVEDSDEEDVPVKKIVEEEDEDLEDDLAAATEHLTVTKPAPVSSTVIAESEEEEEEEEEQVEEEEEEEEREPTPPPPPPKKKVVAKKTLKV